MPIPVLGNILTFNFEKMHLWIHDQKKIYGNVYTIWTPVPQVVFADYDVINEVLITQGDLFNGRNVDGYPDKAFQ
uniref:Beta-1,3-glucan-binding protein n=1 Tax=Strongyloides venezuelensis TaxID=75913 RepID=A0A0K0EZ46_STRVS